MERSLRQSLADSNVAAVTIAVLLLWFIDGLFNTLWGPVFRGISFLFTALAIFDIPTLTAGDGFILVTSASYLYVAAVSFAAAWLLSRWVYDAGPVRTLIRCYKNLARRKYV